MKYYCNKSYVTVDGGGSSNKIKVTVPRPRGIYTIQALEQMLHDKFGGRTVGSLGERLICSKFYLIRRPTHSVRIKPHGGHAVCTQSCIV